MKRIQNPGRMNQIPLPNIDWLLLCQNEPSSTSEPGLNLQRKLVIRNDNEKRDIKLGVDGVNW